MALKQFTFEEMAELDGRRIAIAVNQAIKRAAEDCFDLPGEKAARKVNIQMEFKPILDETGDCSEIDFRVQIKQTIPTRKTRAYDFGLRKNGVLVYNPEALENVDQQTFEFGETEDD